MTAYQHAGLSGYAFLAVKGALTRAVHFIRLVISQMEGEMIFQFFGAARPAACLGKSGHVSEGDRIVGKEREGMSITHCPRRAQHGPRAFQAARINTDRRGLSSSSGQKDYARCED